MQKRAAAYCVVVSDRFNAHDTLGGRAARSIRSCSCRRCRLRQSMRHSSSRSKAIPTASPIAVVAADRWAC